MPIGSGSLPPGDATSIIHTGHEASHESGTLTLDILNPAGHTLRLRVMNGDVDIRHVSVAHCIQLRTTQHNGRTASDAAGGRPSVTITLDMSPCADNRSQLSAASPEHEESWFSEEGYSDSSDSGSVRSGNMEIDSYCD